MRIYVKKEDGKMYEAFQVNENTFKFQVENKTFELSLTESDEIIDTNSLTANQKKRMTKAIFSNDDIIEQLRDAKKNIDHDYSYYSSNEFDFNKLVDETSNER